MARTTAAGPTSGWLPGFDPQAAAQLAQGVAECERGSARLMDGFVGEGGHDGEARRGAGGVSRPLALETDHGVRASMFFRLSGAQLDRNLHPKQVVSSVEISIQVDKKRIPLKGKLKKITPLRYLRKEQYFGFMKKILILQYDNSYLQILILPELIFLLEDYSSDAPLLRERGPLNHDWSAGSVSSEASPRRFALNVKPKVSGGSSSAGFARCDLSGNAPSGGRLTSVATSAFSAAKAPMRLAAA